MYTRQVEKDGIRRTLMTSSGCATERHFSKDDLKKLFVLSPRGVCNMLEKIRVRDPKGVEGSSGKCSILERHEEVVGLSSHDKVYINSIVDLSHPCQSPFAGTPVKAFIRRNSVHHPMKLVFDNSAKEARPLRFSTEYNIENSIKSGENLERHMDERVAENHQSEKMIQKSLSMVHEMTEKGKIAESLELLFQLVESNELQGKHKLIVHKKITSRLMFFGWD